MNASRDENDLKNKLTEDTPMTEQVTVQAKQNKAAEARKIFNEHYGTKTRKDIINLFVTQANLTEKGAATYYQKYKQAAGAKTVEVSASAE